ncbi:hypothetical protein TNCV_3274391 [Trichonephila clavipes]|nr:hypothetical protein TNCV_3274391 [Trichonephila clavipes]
MSRSGVQSKARPQCFVPKQACSPPGGTTAYQLQHRSVNRQVANVIAKIDANLALLPTFRYFFIESPL